MQRFIKAGDDVETMITRPPSTSLLGISSNDRYTSWNQRRANPTNPFSFIIQKNQAIMNGYFRRLAMTEFRMNWTLPNIASAWGNDAVMFNWVQTSVLPLAVNTFILTIPDGFYGAEELALAIQESAISGGYNGTSTHVAGLTGFTANIMSTFEDDQVVFSAPVGYTFWFAPVAYQNQRQLFDMLALPTMGTPGVNSFFAGIPDLRATEYVDIVCSQLTNNMLQKDASSAPIVRDMLARIYLDDDVPSQSTVTTNYFNNTPVSTTSSTYVVSDDNTVNFTVASTTGFSIGAQVNVSGTSGGTNWNGPALVSGITGSTTLYLYYVAVLSGTATGTATIANVQGTLTQTSKPVTTWDDRVNGVTPFVLYRQFPYPKQIRWEHTQPIGNLRFEMFDSQGRSIADLWSPYSAGTFLSNITGTAYTSTGISAIASSPLGAQFAQVTVASSVGFAVGQNVVVAGVTGGTYNAGAVIVSVPNATTIAVQYVVAPTGTISSYSGATLRDASNSVTFTVGSSAGLNVGQIVYVSGIAGTGVTGYNGQGVVSIVPSSTTVVVQFGSTTVLAGSSLTYTSAVITNTIDYQSSFAWNTSILCSED